MNHPYHSEVTFQDNRAIVEVLFVFESRLRIIFDAEMAEELLSFRRSFNLNGATYQVQLVYLGATDHSDIYRFSVSGQWTTTDADTHQYFLRSSASWLEYWGSGFELISLEAEVQNNANLYEQRASDFQQYMSKFAEVTKCHDYIVSEMKKGAKFATSHKEGGTIITYQFGGFSISDYGESNNHQRISDKQHFFDFLSRFYELETRQASSTKDDSELKSWQLITRFLHY